MKTSNIILRFLMCFALIILVNSFSFSQESPLVMPNNIITINASSGIKYQTIEHFGASDAWSCQFVGKWPRQKKESIAQLLFDKSMDEKGNPKGIGLSLWRFNLGAGSADQGENSDIKDSWRRAESFLMDDGTYDWTKQEGQVWFAQEAKKYGVENLLAFTNSPPVQMTRNGKAYANNGESNLSAEKYTNFANYLTKSIIGLQNKGLTVNYISPINEPQWDWSDAGQEGTPFYNNEIAGFIKVLNKHLREANISTKIDIAEAGKINYLYENADKEGRGSQIDEFFNPESANYLGNLSHVSKTISGHSYFTSSPFLEAKQQRTKLGEVIKKHEDLNFWMSEYCILGDNNGEIKGSGRDLGIDPALYIARLIFNDLTAANATAWHWWLAVSPFNYKDGLIYIDKDTKDGNFYPSKMLWALGNYSRFIRPGYQRIDVKLDGKNVQNSNFLTSAYQSPNSDEIVYVIINSGIESQQLDIQRNGTIVSEFETFITSTSQDLSKIDLLVNNTLVIPAQSIVTVISNK